MATTYNGSSRYTRKKLVNAYEGIIMNPKLPGCAMLTVPFNDIKFPDGSVYEVSITAKFKSKK